MKATINTHCGKCGKPANMVIEIDEVEYEGKQVSSVKGHPVKSITYCNHPFASIIVVGRDDLTKDKT